MSSARFHSRSLGTRLRPPPVNPASAGRSSPAWARAIEAWRTSAATRLSRRALLHRRRDVQLLVAAPGLAPVSGFLARGAPAFRGRGHSVHVRRRATIAGSHEPLRKAHDTQQSRGARKAMRRTARFEQKVTQH